MYAGRDVCRQKMHANTGKYRQYKYRQNHLFPIKNSWGFIGNGRNVSICVAFVWHMLVWQSCGRPVWQLRGACLRDLRLPRPRVASAFVQTTTCIDGADGDANAGLLIPTPPPWLVGAGLAGWRWPGWLALAWLVGAGLLVVGLPAT